MWRMGGPLSLPCQNINELFLGSACYRVGKNKNARENLDEVDLRLILCRNSKKGTPEIYCEFRYTETHDL